MHNNTKYLLVGALHALAPITILWLFTKGYNMVMYLTYRGGTTFNYISEGTLYIIQVLVLIISIFTIKGILVKSEIGYIRIIFRFFLNWFIITALLFATVSIINLYFKHIGYWSWAILFYIFGGFITLVISCIISSILATPK